MGDGDLPWRLVETRVSSNIKQALTTDICFLKDVLGESVGENGMVHCLRFFWVRFTVLQNRFQEMMFLSF